MIQGTTPTHIFNIPFSTDLIKTVQITYAQNGVPVVEKETDDCVCSDNTITVKLTQEETLKFNASCIVEIQVRVLTTGNDALTSNIKRISCNRVLNTAVLS